MALQTGPSLLAKPRPGDADRDLGEIIAIMAPFAGQLRAICDKAEMITAADCPPTSSNCRAPADSREARLGPGTNAPAPLAAGYAWHRGGRPRAAGGDPPRLAGPKRASSVLDCGPPGAFADRFFSALPLKVQGSARARDLATGLDDSDASWLRLHLPDVGRSTQSSKVAGHAVAEIEMLVQLACEFKIGVTTDPKYRWLRHDCGYARDRFQKMLLLWASLTKAETDMLEYALIARFGRDPSCLNRAPGGEGPLREEGVHFVYCVWKPC